MVVPVVRAVTVGRVDVVWRLARAVAVVRVGMPGRVAQVVLAVVRVPCVEWVP